MTTWGIIIWFAAVACCSLAYRLFLGINHLKKVVDAFGKKVDGAGVSGGEGSDGDGDRV